MLVNKIIIYKFFTFMCFLVVIQGCVAVQSFPTVARAGDTVTLAVGSAEGMTKTNTTLTYTPDSTGIPIDIPQSNIRSVFPIYPDKRSPAWSNSTAMAIDTSAGHGGWLTVLVVDLPTTIPVGTGIIKVETPATYSPFSDDVNDVDINLEILPGTGIPSTFNYKDGGGDAVGNLSKLEPKPHYLIKPDFTSIPFIPSHWPSYGAIEIKVVGTIAGPSESTINAALKIVLDDMEQHLVSHTQTDWVRNGDTITINIISTIGLLKYFQSRASIFFSQNTVDYSSIPTITARYFDIDGNEVDGPLIKASFVSN